MTQRTQRSPRTRQGMAVLAAALLSATAACTASQAPAPGPAADAPLPGAPSPAGGGHGKAARGITIAATGDVLPHASIIRQANADAGATVTTSRRCSRAPSR